jgi:hypothetical protein
MWLWNTILSNDDGIIPAVHPGSCLLSLLTLVVCPCGAMCALHTVTCLPCIALSNITLNRLQVQAVTTDIAPAHDLPSLPLREQINCQT